jgi:hypothetical protein
MIRGVKPLLACATSTQNDFLGPTRTVMIFTQLSQWLLKERRSAYDAPLDTLHERHVQRNGTYCMYHFTGIEHADVSMLWPMLGTQRAAGRNGRERRPL